MKVLSASFILFALFLLSCHAQPQQITNLPGFSGQVPFSQYSGYITVNTTYQRAMYYWFVESQGTPSTDPVILWLQGGPGCSGIWAIFEEHGPYRINPGGAVVMNPYSWNKNANIIYVDAPVGVGFSYSNTTEGLSTNDNQTASDNFAFLNGWYAEFPSFQSNKLFITGESYGGVYVPTLTYEILTSPPSVPKSQLAGLVIGNPVINCPQNEVQGPSIQIDLYYYHGLISFLSRQNWYNQGCGTTPTAPACISMYQSIVDSIGPYFRDNLYQNFCTGNATLDVQDNVPGCISVGERTEIYLNRADVQQAIHTVTKPWLSCTFGIVTPFNYTKYNMNMLTYYEYIFNNYPNLRILIYSGDIDIASVPHALTQNCLSYLPVNVVTPWTRWTAPGPEIPIYIPEHKEKTNITAGYIQIYDKYAYATVKGAGHEVPLYQPYLAYYLFQRFVIEGSYP